WGISPRQPSGKNIIRWLLKKRTNGSVRYCQYTSLNKTAEIGYWLDESHQGQGIISQALQALIHHYAQSGELRRFVIKCRVDNPQSNQVALRNGFILEGCLKQAEFLNDAYDDVNLYARIIDS
ncbi:50S ribosomal protein L7/L12-serine acetyltransferase, partial [Shigella sonnei]